MSEEITPPIEPAAFSVDGLDDAAVQTAYESARTRGAELAAKADLTPEEITELGLMAEHVTVAGARLDEITATAAQVQAQRDSFGALPERTLPVAVPVAPVAAVEPAPAAVAPVVASVPSVSQMAAQAVLPTAVAKSGENRITAYVSGDAAGFVGKSAGEAYDGLTQVSEALIASAQQYGRSGGGRGGRQAIAQFKRDRGAEFTIEARDDNNRQMEVLRHARSESRLHGGSLAKQFQHNVDSGKSLTAAAGWCAPSENVYDLCRLWDGSTGILDLPTVTARRGGLNYTAEPSFAEIYANAVAVGGGSNFLTEAQVIADTVKTCSVIPCPDFTDRRLDVMALCIRVSFLQAAGYPELVNLWSDGLLAAHEQEMNRLILADMITTAGAATVFTNPAFGDDSFTAALLAAVELAREDLVYQQLMPFNSTLEIVLPHWVIAQIRADLSRRTGVDMLNVQDSTIASLFSTRGVRPQFVRGWQDGLITGGALNPAFPGGDATTPFMTSLPQSVQFLAYPAGSVAVARQDVVTLTNVYDAASLATNQFTALFAEEGFAPIYPCPGLRLYTVAGCVAGPTGANTTGCTAPPVPA
jgi:hypothetical protein